MKPATAVATIVCAVALCFLPLHATSCIVGKSFSVPQVCGIVAERDGGLIPNAKIQVNAKNHPESVKEMTSDQNGLFSLSKVADGEYEIRVSLPGYWDARQPFRIAGLGRNQKCKKPIKVVMVPAGGCSYVENAWTKSELKRRAEGPRAKTDN